MASANILPPPLPTVKLDKLDYKILFELDSDAFQSFAKLGKKLKVGRDVINYRVKRLEKEGIIRGYITNIDYSKLGFLIGALYIKLKFDSPKLRKEILNYYSKRGDVWWLFEMEGKFDISFAWFAKSLTELRDLQRDLTKKYAKNIGEFKFRLFNKFYHFKRNYLNKKSQKNNYFVLEAKPKKVTDKIDDKILKLLSENARLDYVSIAKKLKLSAAQVHYKIKKLKESKIILGAKAFLDLQKLGIMFYKLDLYLDDYSVYEKLLKFAITHPNITYAYDAFGGADIGLDIEATNYLEFKSVEDSIKEKFSKSIERSEFIIFTKEYKLKYFPNI